MFRHSIAASACALMLMAALPAAHARPTVTVAPDSRSVVLESRGDSLQSAIEALAAEAGFSFRAGGSVDLGVPVEGTFQGSLDDVLARLLTGYDYLVVRGAGSAEAPGPVQRVVVTYAKAVPGKVTPPPPAAAGDKDAAEKSDVAKLLEQQAVSQAKAANAPASSAATPNASASQQRGGAPAATTAGSGSSARGGTGGSARGGTGQAATGSGGLAQGNAQGAAAITASPQLQEQIRATTAKAQQDLQALVEALRSSACPAGGCQPQ